MLYKEFKDLKLSALGMGCMRLPLVDGDDAKIDVQATRDMVAYAMEKGVNYYDTAWGYHGGTSETVMGEVLKGYPRESFYLATKFPGYDLANMDKVVEIFNKQLEKLQVEYFDFYLIHNVCEKNIDDYLDERHGIMSYLLEQKAAGRIRHLGFSAHGDIPVMRRFLEKYGEHMEFCQIQLNWLDWEFQNAKGKIELLNEYHLPVWVMEPVRGGKLATLDEGHEERLRALRPEASAAEWAFRFLQTLPEVCVTLSGMSNFDQLKENIATFEEDKPLSNDEMGALLGVASDMLGKHTVPCTACHYCTPHCPQGLDIPRLLELYNQYLLTGKGDFIAPMVLSTFSEDKQPGVCIGCGSCAAVCPQGIDIPGALADFAEKLAG